MPRLVLSPTVSSRLCSIAAYQSADEGKGTPIDELRHAIRDQPAVKPDKVTASGPAVPSPVLDRDATQVASLVVDHKLLIALAAWSQSSAASVVTSTISTRDLTLSQLVAGCHVYVPPKPVFHRSKELEDSLAAIRKAQEEAEYLQMSTHTFKGSGGSVRPFALSNLAGRSDASQGISKAYTNIAGTDPSLPLTQRIAAQYGLSDSNGISSKQQKAAEEEQWNEVQRQLSVILNVFLSVVATATAAWWASGTAAIATKVLTSLAVAVITAIAEIVLYNRYRIYVSNSKRYGKSRMKGSDLKSSSSAESQFRPLKLSTSGDHTVFDKAL
ncbi:hypothetical protein BCV70DRAFT_200898 [Testicularia cyperi]|uniref:Uncharacterized protein n=1 Tax=Testicularia cyperi TaxID=1882483 RepID=A0A317XLZ0_9BASI|nr:hypothetical protein BCV70DRAFT_200898 [Testicularia cyperi]